MSFQPAASKFDTAVPFSASMTHLPLSSTATCKATALVSFASSASFCTRAFTSSVSSVTGITTTFCAPLNTAISPWRTSDDFASLDAFSERSASEDLICGIGLKTKRVSFVSVPSVGSAPTISSHSGFSILYDSAPSPAFASSIHFALPCVLSVKVSSLWLFQQVTINLSAAACNGT